MNSFEVSLGSLDPDLDSCNEKITPEFDVTLDEDLIDFSELQLDVDITLENKYAKKKETVSYTMDNGYPINYDNETTGYYRAIRKTKVDPIFECPIDERFAFKFKYQWDPYTGKRTEADPYGPLYFDPDSLIKHFYTVRLNNLWNSPEGEYEGYHGDAVGNGPDFCIKGRGVFPEYNIFRLPILNCYLTKDHNNQHVTTGPELTNDEITEIANLAKIKDNIKGMDYYRKSFGRSRPNLIQLKKMWDIATDPAPNVNGEDPSDYSPQELALIYEKNNKEAVIYLRKMVG